VGDQRFHPPAWPLAALEDVLQGHAHHRRAHRRRNGRTEPVRVYSVIKHLIASGRYDH
jgi:hypothetical protein